MTCPSCKSEMVRVPLGWWCSAPSNEKHVCGTTIGEPGDVVKVGKDGKPL